MKCLVTVRGILPLVEFILGLCDPKSEVLTLQPGWCISLFSRSFKIFNVILFVLRFYRPLNPIGSCLVWSVYLTTLLLGRLSPLSS